MPLYEYQCGRCDRPFEKYARTFTEQPECPSCGGAEVSKLFSTFAVSSGVAVTGGRNTASSCGEGPPCGAAQCGRLPN